MDADFADVAERWLAALPASLVRETISAAHVVRLHANDVPWHGTGVQLKAGQAYSFFASGRVQWSPRDPTLYGGPRQHLCVRITPGGRVVNPTCDTGTFVADVDGELELGIRTVLDAPARSSKPSSSLDNGLPSQSLRVHCRKAIA